MGRSKKAQALKLLKDNFVPSRKLGKYLKSLNQLCIQEMYFRHFKITKFVVIVNEIAEEMWNEYKI